MTSGKVYSSPETLNRIGWAADQLATALNPKGGKRDLAAVFKADEVLWRLVAEVEPADPLEGVRHADKLRKQDANWARALGLKPQAPRPRTAKTLTGWSAKVNDALAHVRSFAGRIHQAILAFDPDDPAKQWSWPGLDEVGLFARSAQVLLHEGYKAMGPPVDAPLECLTKPTGRAKTPARAVPAGGAPLEEPAGPGQDQVSPEPQVTPTAKSKRVTLFGPGDAPLIDGKKKSSLTKVQYKVILALIHAGEQGLTKDGLIDKSGHGDGRKVMRRLADKDSAWKNVLVFAGKTGRGYRIK